MALRTLLTSYNDPGTGGLKRRGAAPVVVPNPDPGAGAVLLDEDFNSRTLGAFNDATWDAIFGAGRTSSGKATGVARSSIVNDLEHGGRAYRAKLLANTTGTANGITATIQLPKQVESATYEMTFRFVGSFAPYKGGKLPGLAGVPPGVSDAEPAGGGKVLPYTLGWSGRHMWLGGTGDTNWPDFVGTDYMYGYDQVSEFGDHVKYTVGGTGSGSSGTSVIYAPNTWYTVKTHYQMNTAGAADGILRTWLNDAIVVNRTNRAYRSATNVKIGLLFWSLFRGGSTAGWQSPTEDYIEITSVKITEGLV